MSQELRSHIAKYIQLTDEEFAGIVPSFLPRRLRKKTYILQEGEICKYLIFVKTGMLRAFTVDSKGEEHVIHFAAENWWLADDFSFWNGKQAIYFIEALEDSELLVIDHESLVRLFERYPRFERYFRLLLTNHAIALDRRIAASLSMSAEERYLQLIKLYPNLIQRVSLKHVSSYLGITPESLSRIRNNLAKRKR